MKKAIFLLLPVFTVVFFLNACDNEENQVIDLPEIIDNFLADNYADYSIDESAEETLCDGTLAYEVELEDSNDHEIELTFDTEGNLLFSESEINSSDLPNEVINSISTNFSEYSIEESDRLDMADGSTRYEVELKGSPDLEVLMESDGTVVCQEEDTDD